MMNLRILLLLLAVPAMVACSATATAPEDAIVVKGRYFDGHDRIVENGEIVVHQDRIHCAGAAGHCATGNAARVVHVSEGTLLPGLVDLHVHSRPHYLGFFPAAGVTTIRDANNTLEMIEHLKGKPGAPRVLASGPLLDGEASVIKGMSETPGFPGEEPWETIMPVLIETPDQARSAVRELASRGVDVIKLYEQLPEDAYTAATAEAQRLGIPVMTDLGLAGTRGLTDASVDVLQAARAGAGSIEHLGGFALAYERLGGDPRAEALDDGLLDKLVDEFANTGAAVVPTLTNTVHFILQKEADLAGIPMAAEAATIFGGWWGQLFNGSQDERSHERKLIDYRFARALLPRLVERGVMVGVGSDTPASPFTVPGGGVHQEMAYLVEFGLTERQALQAATGTAGRIIGDESIGVIRSGARADLLAIEGNPFENIHASRNLQWVMINGDLHAMEALRKAAAADMPESD